MVRKTAVAEKSGAERNGVAAQKAGRGKKEEMALMAHLMRRAGFGRRGRSWRGTQPRGMKPRWRSY